MRSTLRGSATGPIGLKERGYLLVWFAIIVVVLFAIGGMSYDFGQRYLEDTRAQRAADSAALAGVVYLNGSVNEKSDAQRAAWAYAARNGFPDHNDVEITFPEENQIKVTIHAVADNFFARVIGVGAQDFWRSSQAAYDVPTPLGSPSNVLGNQPLDTTAAGEQDWTIASGYQPTTNSLWLDIDAPRTVTHAGDQYNSADCSPRSGTASPDNCFLGTTDTQTNQNYAAGGQADGEFYTIRKPSTPGTPGALNVQVFDPTFANTGSDCTGGSGGANDLAIRMWNGEQFLFWFGSTPIYGKDLDPQGRFSSMSLATFQRFATRYAANPNGVQTDANGFHLRTPQKWCTGDNWAGACGAVGGCGGSGGGASNIDSGSAVGPPGVAPPESSRAPAIRPAAQYPTAAYDGSAVVTTYTLYKPGTTRSSHSAGNQICTEQFGTYYDALYEEFAGNVTDAYVNGTTAPFGAHKFRDTFRQWVTLCKGNLPTAPGDYLLRVQTDVKPGTNPDSDKSVWWNNPDTNPAGFGSNKFSLRAGICGGLCPSGPTPTSTENRGLRLWANEHITVAANVASDSKFFLTRVAPSTKNRMLTLTFFDPGDLTACGFPTDSATCGYKYQPGFPFGSSVDVPNGTLKIGHTLANGTFKEFTDCTATVPNGPSPKPTVPGAHSSCIFSVGLAFNGRLLSVAIPLLATGGPMSDCVDETVTPGSTECWVQGQFVYPSNATSPEFLRPTDVTTWTAAINGSPVRLTGG